MTKEVVTEVAEEVVETAPEAEVEVAEEVKPEVAEAPKKGMKYYRSKLNGLTVVLGNHKTIDPSELDVVRFRTRIEMYQGDAVKVGYLATDDKRAHEILAKDINVTEISEKEFNGR